MIRVLFILFGILLIFSSCKKTKLKGEYAIFKGKWEWVFSVKTTYYPSIQYTVDDTIKQTNGTDTYELEFLEKGEIRYIQNGQEQRKHRILFRLFELTGGCLLLKNNTHWYSAVLDNDDSNSIGGCVNQDSIRCNFSDFGFPFSDYDDGSAQITYSHYYLKE